ncbi:hypothetical protein [Streptomyces sp. SM11]|uniref:hypothetical protein n=1 Tax=Streptomyces sp. SM11 TaxID=565557 RepID=UPI00215619CD|nr:hypothetical protein [Streptomyces sp. SM11]
MTGPGGASARDRRARASAPTAGSAGSHRTTPPRRPDPRAAIHTSRQAPDASVLGTVTGATAVSTDHSVELSAPALGGALGPAYSLALTSSGTDSPRVWSSEAGSAASRPQLEPHLRS